MVLDLPEVQTRVGPATLQNVEHAGGAHTKEPRGRPSTLEDPAASEAHENSLRHGCWGSGRLSRCLLRLLCNRRLLAGRQCSSCSTCDHLPTHSSGQPSDHALQEAGGGTAGEASQSSSGQPCHPFCPRPSLSGRVLLGYRTGKHQPSACQGSDLPERTTRSPSLVQKLSSSLGGMDDGVAHVLLEAGDLHQLISEGGEGDGAHHAPTPSQDLNPVS